MQKQIPTKRLRVADIPVIDLARLEWAREIRGQVQPLWEFALSFDGYRYFGGDDEVIGRLGSFAQSVQLAYRKDGQIPRLGEIGMLRACLFFEQRSWCKWGKVEIDLGREDVAYLVALADAVRERVTRSA